MYCMNVGWFYNFFQFTFIFILFSSRFSFRFYIHSEEIQFRVLQWCKSQVIFTTFWKQSHIFHWLFISDDKRDIIRLMYLCVCLWRRTRSSLTNWPMRFFIEKLMWSRCFSQLWTSSIYEVFICNWLDILFLIWHNFQRYVCKHTSKFNDPKLVRCKVISSCAFERLCKLRERQLTSS